MAEASFFWHDYETFGADPARDRPAQFAGQRTDLQLEPIGAPVSIFCRPAPDVLPHPIACLITGITPQLAERRGVDEMRFAALVNEQLGSPGTCGVGYNSLRFDDAFTRHLLYRNFYDPYAREWSRGNSRWDLIDLARMAYALRPDGIVWPRREDGAPSFKLEDLAQANGLRSGDAHEALSDVNATIALARLIRNRQPKLFEYYLKLRDKREALRLLDWQTRTPVVHVSSKFPATRGHLSIVLPLTVLPDQANAVVVYDLASAPDDLLALDADELRDRVFVATADLPEGELRVPLKLIRANRCPALAPLSVLKDVDTRRIGLDVDACLRHAGQLHDAANLGPKVAAVFARADEGRALDDPELSLYQGFASPADRAIMDRVRSSSPEQLASASFPFKDERYAQLLFRYRARNFPHTLSLAEQASWQQFRQRRLWRDDGLSTLTLPAYFELLGALRAERAASSRDIDILDALDLWGRQLQSDNPAP